MAFVGRMEMAFRSRVDDSNPRRMSRPRSALDHFFHPTSVSPALDVLRASARLLDPVGPDRSHGQVVILEAPRRKRGKTIAHRRGIWSEAIFGPLEDLCCACGETNGAERVGETCKQCGVLCAASALRDERFGHLLLPIGVVHPALAPAIGELLRMTAEEVRWVALQSAYVPVEIKDQEPIWSDRDEDSWRNERGERLEPGLDYLRSRLAEAPPSPLRADLEAAGFSPSDLLVKAIPVVPPGDRPLCAPDDPTILGPQLGRVNEAYLGLIEQANQLDRLLQINAPLVIMAAGMAGIQERFDILYGALTGAPAPVIEQRWRRAVDPDEGPPSSEPYRALFVASPRAGSESEGEGAQPIAALWVDDERLLVQLPRAAFVIDARDGRVLAEHPIVGLTARFTDEPGRRVVFLGRAGVDSGDEQEAVAVLSMDTPEGRWLDAYPSDLASIAADDGNADEDDEGETEYIDLLDFVSGDTATIEVAAEHPAKLFAIARGDRFVWLGGRGEAGGVIVNTETAITHVALDAIPFDPSRGPFLTATGSLMDEPPDDDEADGGKDNSETDDNEDDSKADESARAPAFVLTPERRFCFLNPDGVVAENTEQLFTVAFPRCAAAFAPRGDRLLVLTREEGLIIEVSRRPRVERRIDLRPLALRLGGMDD
jgi:hypothetical protein